MKNKVIFYSLIIVFCIISYTIQYLFSLYSWDIVILLLMIVAIIYFAFVFEFIPNFRLKSKDKNYVNNSNTKNND